jgi:hypothetical protein
VANEISLRLQNQIAKYIHQACAHIGCNFQVRFLNSRDSHRVIFDVYGTTDLGKKVLVSDVRRILNGNTIESDLKHLLEGWCQIITTGESGERWAIVDKQRLSYEIYPKQQTSVKVSTNLETLLKTTSKQGFYVVLDTSNYLVLRDVHSALPGSKETWSHYLRQFLPTLSKQAKDTPPRVVPPAVKDVRDKIEHLEVESASEEEGLWKQWWKSSNHTSRRSISPPVLKDILYDLIRHIQDLESRLVKQEISCDWENGKWIFGHSGRQNLADMPTAGIHDAGVYAANIDSRSCEDDLYIVCRQGIVKAIEKGC